MSTFIDSRDQRISNSIKTTSTINLLEESPHNDGNDLNNFLPNNKKNSLSGDNSSCSNCNNGVLIENSSEGEIEDDQSSIGSSVKHCVNYDMKCGYLIAVHRKISRQDTYFLSHQKTKPSLFGVPILIPLYDGVKNKDLYCSVWIQVARLLSPLPPIQPDQANHATDCDDSLGYDFPFTLRTVAENGRMCALCPWSRFCRGCTIPCNEEPFLHGIISSSCPSSSEFFF